MLKLAWLMILTSNHGALEKFMVSVSECDKVFIKRLSVRLEKALEKFGIIGVYKRGFSVT